MTRTSPLRLVNLHGELDIRTAPSAVDSRHIPRQASEVTVDLARVTFIDATGLGAIVGLRNELIAAGGSLKLTGASPRVARIFALGSLSTLL